MLSVLEKSPMYIPFRDRLVESFIQKSVYFSIIKSKLRDFYRTKFATYPEELLYIDISASKITSAQNDDHQTPSLPTATVKTICDHIDASVVTLLESPPGSGKTTFCQTLAYTQSDTFLVVYITFDDLLEYNDKIDSLRTLLTLGKSFVDPDDTSRVTSLAEVDAQWILWNEIPVLFIFDGFEDINTLLQLKDPPFYAKDLSEFLHNFVDPKTRAAHRQDNTAPSLVRPCDAVLVTSREDRIKNKYCDFDSLSTMGVVDKWRLDLWNEQNIETYHEKYFRLGSSESEKFSTFDQLSSSNENALLIRHSPRSASSQLLCETIADSPLPQQVIASTNKKSSTSSKSKSSSSSNNTDSSTSSNFTDSHKVRTQSHSPDQSRHSAFNHPLFVSLLCQGIARNIIIKTQIRPSNLFEASLRGLFNRNREQLNRCRGRSMDDQEFNEVVDRCLDFASEAAITRCIDRGCTVHRWFRYNSHQDRASTTTLPHSPCVATYPWIQFMIAAGVVVEVPNQQIVLFPHSMYIEFLCARFVAYENALSKENIRKGHFTLQTLPFEGVFRTIWMLLADIAKNDPKSKIKTSDIIEVIAQQECWKEENLVQFREHLINPDHRDARTEIELVLPLRLVTELTIILDPVELLPRLPHILYSMIAEICGEFGALDTLKWLMKQENLSRVTLEACLARATQRQSLVNTRDLVDFVRRELFEFLKGGNSQVLPINEDHEKKKTVTFCKAKKD